LEAEQLQDGGKRDRSVERVEVDRGAAGRRLRALLLGLALLLAALTSLGELAITSSEDLLIATV
jgi:hypothetical protein